LSRNRGARLVAAAASIVVVDAAWLTAAATRAAAPLDGWAAASGGLGLGGAIAPDWSFRDVDARLATSCESELSPLPGLACSDPNHGTGVALLPDRR
jgi:hypothetical protein